MIQDFGAKLISRLGALVNPETIDRGNPCISNQNVLDTYFEKGSGLMNINEYK